MKKILVVILSALALSCLIAGCGTQNDKAIGSNVKFLHFVDGDGTTFLDYELNQYFNSEDLQSKIDGINVPYYTLSGAKYSDGTQFSVEKDDINAYITTHEADLTVTKHGFLLNSECPAFTVVADLTPIDYTVTYMDVEDPAFVGPTTYNVNSDPTLPTPSREDYYFQCWYIKGQENGQEKWYYITSLPTQYPENLTVYALWEPYKIKVTYDAPVGMAKPQNPDTVFQKDGSVELQPIQSTAAYKFKGWKLNGEYVTRLDPAALCNHENIETAVYLTADIEYFTFTARYFVDGELYDSKTFDFNNFAVFTTPEIPAKAHYTGHWSERVTDYKDYEIQAVYDIDRYDVGVQTNIGGYTVDERKYEYGTTYETIYSQLSYSNKVLLGLYFDSNFTSRVSETALIEASGKLYAKWSDRYTVSSVEDWSLLNEHPDSFIVLESDLNFLGEAIPVVAAFSGVFDGQGHTIYNFINQNNSCSSNYGLICENTGTVRNITFNDGVYTAVTNTQVENKNVGFLCGVNKGTIENIKISNINVKINESHSTRPLGNSPGSSEKALSAGVLTANNQGTIKNCSLDNSLKADIVTSICAGTAYRLDDNYVRTWAYYGLIAGTNSGQISSVTSYASISTSATLEEYLVDGYSKYYAYIYYPLQIGGIVGSNQANGIISDSLSDAKVTAKFTLNAKRNYFGIVDIGGVSGYNCGQINKCVANKVCALDAYANAEIRMGGLCGTSDGDGVIKTSYSYARFTIGNANNSTEKTYLGGIAGLNNAAITYSYAVVESLAINAFDGKKIDGYVNGYFGSMFGYANNLSSVIHCFGVVDADLTQLPLAYKSKQGALVGGTVVKCFVLATENTAGLTATDGCVATECDTKEILLENIKNEHYENMGYTQGEDGYPVFPQ